MSASPALVFRSCYSFMSAASVRALLMSSSPYYSVFSWFQGTLLRDSAMCMACLVIFPGGLLEGLLRCPRDRHGCSMAFFGRAVPRFPLLQSLSAKVFSDWRDWLCFECGTGVLREWNTYVDGAITRRVCVACGQRRARFFGDYDEPLLFTWCDGVSVRIKSARPVQYVPFVRWNYDLFPRDSLVTIDTLIS